MRLQLSESGYSEPFKPLEELEVNFGIAPDSPLGSNYYFLGFKDDSKISRLLEENDESPNFKIYLFKSILYLVFKTEPVFYTIRMHNDDISAIKEQLLKEKKVLFLTYNNDQLLENSYIYDIII